MAQHYDYKIKRTARYTWRCAYCGKTIPAGTQYMDYGRQTKDHRWIHTRQHIICCTKPEYELPMPVSLHDGTKEWLLGAVYMLEGGPVLLTHDWDENGKHHYRTHVYDEHGRRISAKEFV